MLFQEYEKCSHYLLVNTQFVFKFDKIKHFDFSSNLRFQLQETSLNLQSRYTTVANKTRMDLSKAIGELFHQGQHLTFASSIALYIWIFISISTFSFVNYLQKLMGFIPLGGLTKVQTLFTCVEFHLEFHGLLLSLLSQHLTLFCCNQQVHYPGSLINDSHLLEGRMSLLDSHRAVMSSGVFTS